MSNRREAPPVVTGVAGAYTTSGTWAIGVGHYNNFRQDRIRYAGIIGCADVTSDFYVDRLPIEFRLKGAMLFQEVGIRVKRSSVFLGARLAYIDATNRFDLGLDDVIPPELLTFDLKQTGLAARMLLDNRDSTTMPTRGPSFDVEAWRYDEAFGGDFNYWRANAQFLDFVPLGGRFFLDTRVAVSAVDGDPPFFGYPWIKLRGIAAMRYQNEFMVVRRVLLLDVVDRPAPERSVWRSRQ